VRHQRDAPRLANAMMKSAPERGSLLAVKLVPPLLLVFVFAALATQPARADVWACKDQAGVVRFADRKLKGFRCVLYAKTPEVKKPAPDSGLTATAPGAFSRPRHASRYAPIPAPEPGQRFSGDEPAELGAREKLYSPYIEEASRLYDIPEPFIRAVIRVESNYRYRAVSSAGAKGLMQLMPSVIGDMGVSDPFDPRANVLGGTRLLRVLADRFAGDIVKVLAAYHAGSGAVASADGIPYEATESYVRSVLDRYYEYKSRR
jgi:hypothetical protein